MRPSFSLLVSGLFIAFMLNSIYSIVQLFFPPKCDSPDVKLCLSSFLAQKPRLQLLLVTYPTELYSYSQLSDENLVATWSSLKYTEQFTRDVTIPLPRSTRRNGTLFLYAFLTESPRDKSENWIQAIQRQTTLSSSVELTQYLTPEAKTFNLLGSEETADEKKATEKLKGADKQKPVAHITKKIRIGLLTDLHILPRKDLQDIAYMIRVIHSDTYLPPLRFDKVAIRLKDYYQMNKTEESYILELEFAPASLGNMRLSAQVEGSMESMKTFGFSAKDLDDVKSIFLDTNVYLIGLTMFVAAVHLLFDFLAFKNEIVYWKQRKTTIGLSSRTTLWRCFSQIVVFLYLLEEKSSILIIGPGGISAIIEIWKVTKAFKIKVKFSGGLPRISFGTFSESEKATAKHDVESMKYLSYLLYPLLGCGAVYSLLYMPHKSWYSWTIQTLVNGVYCFGFLFMLPQLFVNYRLKSVAHLPWRAFMYKAFNTFIDDIFAFIITMPTAHRIACFRDDIVFVIYLYQRWLYPVDQTRVDAGGEFEIDVKKVEGTEVEKKKN